MATTYQHVIIGFGIAGQLLICELIQRGVSPSSICIIDPTFLGGALATDYATVLSNTPWWKTRQALAEYMPYSVRVLEQGDKQFPSHECMPVGEIAKVCLLTANAASKSCERIVATVTNFQQKDGVWHIQHTFGSIQSKRVFLTHGANEKRLELFIATIPLTIALDRTLLSRYVSSSDTIVVIGLSHSGTICLDHLHVLGIPTIAIYNTPTPFQYSRDGHYDGIKEGSEKIADAILRGEHATTTQLLSYGDSFKIHKALQKATKCIQCVGFEARPLGGTRFMYNHQTAAIEGHSNLYGYGIAFPGITEQNGKQFPDVSVLSFQEQIRRTLPQILVQE